jgi:predicted Zn-dependent protease
MNDLTKRTITILTTAMLMTVPLLAVADWGKILDLGGKVGKTLMENKDAFSEIPEPREIEMGDGMSAQLLGAVPLVDDAELQRYVNDLGTWLALQTERSTLPWQFGVLDDRDINAFAAPGGRIFVSRGLFMLFRNESELAGVLAHEIAHVVVKHHLEDIQEKSQSGLLKGLGGIAVGEMAGPGWDQVAQKFINAGVDIWESGLNREDELEADHMGVVIAARGGFDPYGLMGVLNTLNQINPDSESYKLMYATHPSTSDRIASLEQLMEGEMEEYAGQARGTVQLALMQQKLETGKAPQPAPAAAKEPAKTATAAAAKGAPGSLNGDRDAVAEAQYLLSQLGFKPGAVDGTYGQGTRDAVMGFQKIRGLTATGDVTKELLTALKSAVSQ